MENTFWKWDLEIKKDNFDTTVDSVESALWAAAAAQKQSDEIKKRIIESSYRISEEEWRLREQELKDLENIWIYKK